MRAARPLVSMPSQLLAQIGRVVRTTRAETAGRDYPMTSALKVSSANRATLRRVAPAPKPLSLRLGHSGTAALEELARLRGISRAEAARQAIEEVANRERKRSGLAAEARKLAADPEYVAEARKIVEWMEEVNDDPW